MLRDGGKEGHAAGVNTASCHSPLAMRSRPPCHVRHTTSGRPRRGSGSVPSQLNENIGGDAFREKSKVSSVLIEAW